MPSLKDLKNRIASVKATKKITKAMQMVAAAKLRRAQEAAEASRPYTTRMANVLSNLSAAVEGQADAPVLMAGNGKDDTYLLVVATAERGLCGGFNTAIARKARDRAHALLAEGKEVKILCIGKKGYDALKSEFDDRIIDVEDLRSLRQIGFKDADPIGKKILALFADGAFDVCYLYYSEFKSVISQIPQEQQLIPAKFDRDETEEDAGQSLYEYEPSQEALLTDLLPRNVSVQIFRALLENSASEQGARMSAMDSATRNAGEMIDKLTISYNRQRQAQITKELIEIISGAEAL